MKDNPSSCRPCSILVVGFGSEYRGDDGVGIAVVHMLKTQGLPNVQFIEGLSDGLSLLERWSPTSTVFLIDAVSSGAKPGTIYRFDALAQPIPATISFSSTHTFGIAEMLSIARALQQLPARLIVYGIEGKDFSSGTDLSPEVAEAVREVAEQVMHEVRNLR